MIEVLRVLSVGPALRRPVVFLFNGAEENNHQAAHGFITQHKWAPKVKYLINLEAIGEFLSFVLYISCKVSLFVLYVHCRLWWSRARFPVQLGLVGRFLRQIESLPPHASHRTRALQELLVSRGVYGLVHDYQVWQSWHEGH
jgi:hypothetical protein